MSLTLAIETSSRDYGVAVCAGPRLLAERTFRRGEQPGFPGVGPLVAETLAAAGCSFPDLERIAVDVGPGNLSSVRTGIAYANGLAFSLSRPILAANSLELLALAAAGPAGAAVLCLRNAGGGRVYAGLFRDGSPPQLRHGELAPVVAALGKDQPELRLAGVFRQQAAAALAGIRAVDTGVEVPPVRSLHRLLAAVDGGRAAELVPVARPVTDSSEVFRD